MSLKIKSIKDKKGKLVDIHIKHDGTTETKPKLAQKKNKNKEKLEDDVKKDKVGQVVFIPTEGITEKEFGPHAHWGSYYPNDLEYNPSPDGIVPERNEGYPRIDVKKLDRLHEEPNEEIRKFLKNYKGSNKVVAREKGSG